MYLKMVCKESIEKNVMKRSLYLHDGPPYANGENSYMWDMQWIKFLKIQLLDINSWRFLCTFIPGFDTHGMPTEKKLLKIKFDRIKF